MIQERWGSFDVKEAPHREIWSMKEEMLEGRLTRFRAREWRLGWGLVENEVEGWEERGSEEELRKIWSGTVRWWLEESKKRDRKE